MLAMVYEASVPSVTHWPGFALRVMEALNPSPVGGFSISPTIRTLPAPIEIGLGW
jgi:hypothetical protein